MAHPQLVIQPRLWIPTSKDTLAARSELAAILARKDTEDAAAESLALRREERGWMRVLLKGFFL